MRARQLGRATLKYLLSASAAIILAIGAHEGFSPTPYQDIVGVWTNGYGNTENVGPSTPRVTKAEAAEKLAEHVAKAAPAIDRVLTRPATQGQSDAYQSLVYNIGAAAFAKSTTVKDHNAGRDMDACLRMLRFDHAGGKPVRGLALRRYAEYNVCISDLPNVGYVPRGRP